jgi:hypothetical protein
MTILRAILFAALAIGAVPIVTALAQNCSAIKDDQERLACYDKAAKPIQRPARNDKQDTPVTPEQSALFGDLKRTLLRAGISPEMYIQKGGMHFQLYGNQALIFNIIEKLDILSKAQGVGFKTVTFMSLSGDGLWSFELSKPRPWCSRGLCF